ncbi:hypothetical protein ABDK56_06440 [Sphingomonas sp. ASV193]|uniref:hypothetical protein n=1 Tax=Sphingomonas sp. ASV193 TaxID=3144405 RepID=UPI0032E87BC4
MQAPEILAHEAAPAPSPKGAPRPWWEGRPYVVAMILVAFIPLLYPSFPPLVDLPGHMGRFQVAATIDTSPYLHQWYSFRWRPIGNMGVDLLVVPLVKYLGVELATKLVVMSIPPLTVAGMLWVAREVHNRLPPTVAFALPLAFGYPFLFGFVNFALSMALAFLGMGLWLRLGRLGRTRLRTAIFIPYSFVVYFCHTVGWGMMGLMCFSAEAVRQHDRGLSWWKAILTAGFHAAAMAGPVVMMALWRSDAGGGATTGFWDWARKGDYLLKVVRDRWKWWDIGAAILFLLLPIAAIVHPRLTLSRNLFFSFLVVAAAFALLPWKVFGSAYADMRLVPYGVALIVLAIRFKRSTDFKLAGRIALTGAGFYLLRIAGNMLSLGLAADHQAQIIAALERMPPGSRVASMVWAPCSGWPMERESHLPAFTIIKRDSFSNDQWRLAGAALLTVHKPDSGAFEADASEIVRSPPCRHQGWYIDTAFSYLKPEAFDYLWIIDAPPIPYQLVRDWKTVYSVPGSLLMRKRGASEQLPATPPPETEPYPQAIAR